MYVRTCQECGHKQVMTPPNPANKTESWRGAKCRKCHSAALDYGSAGWTKDKAGKLVPPPLTDE